MAAGITSGCPLGVWGAATAAIPIAAAITITSLPVAAAVTVTVPFLVALAITTLLAASVARLAVGLFVAGSVGCCLNGWRILHIHILLRSLLEERLNIIGCHLELYG